jgi:hypothetical protein
VTRRRALGRLHFADYLGRLCVPWGYKVDRMGPVELEEWQGNLEGRREGVKGVRVLGVGVWMDSRRRVPEQSISEEGNHA